MVKRAELTPLGSCREKSDNGKCRVDAVYIRQNMYWERKTVLQEAPSLLRNGLRERRRGTVEE